MTEEKLKRTPMAKKVKQMVKLLRDERPDYHYLRELFKRVRHEMDIEVLQKARKLPYVPTEEEITRLYKTVWQSRNMQNVLIIKTFIYTGVRVSELVRIKLADIDFEDCQIRIQQGKGKKDRIVPFPISFKEVLAIHAHAMANKGAKYLFESIRKKPYTDRGVRKIVAEYSKQAGLEQLLSPHKLRHFLFTWLKRQGVDDALIQPYSGHESRQSLEVYSKLTITDAQKRYDEIISKFPV